MQQHRKGEHGAAAGNRGRNILLFEQEFDVK